MSAGHCTGAGVGRGPVALHGAQSAQQTCMRCGRALPYRATRPTDELEQLDHRCPCGAHLSLLVARDEAEAHWRAADRAFEAAVAARGCGLKDRDGVRAGNARTAEVRS